MDLLKIRDQIDAIDSEIVSLYEKRMQCVKDVATYKIESGKEIFDRKREESKIKALTGLVADDNNQFAIEQLFTQIMTMSRKMQYGLIAENANDEGKKFGKVDSLRDNNIKVAFQGAKGAYSHLAMKEYFGEAVDAVNVETFYDAMQLIAEGGADYAILPIENSSAGSINEVFDLLVRFDNYIVAEQIIKIQHYLLGVKGAKVEDIDTVYAHPQSFMQSTKFINAHPDWLCVNLKNNAFAANKVAQENNKNQAAIASAWAGEYYGLEALAKGINDNDSNETRFIVIANKKICEENANKISICFELPDESGALYRALSHIIYNNINMTKIESKAIGDMKWQYRFFLDIEGNLTDAPIRNVITSLKDEVINFRILGNYYSNTKI